MITVKNRTFGYNKKKIFNDCNLHIPQGQSGLITGINGVGKSTLLRLMAGVLQPDKGKILDSEKLGKVPRAKIGFISDRLSLYESLTVSRAIELHRSVYRIQQFDDSLIRHTRIKMNQRIKELSIGQRTILQLNLVLGAEPEVLLIDEVIHALDAYLRKFFLEQVIDLLSRRQVTVVMVNVNFHDIEHLVDRVILLKDGEIAVDEPIESLKDKVKRVTARELPKDIPVLSQGSYLGQVQSDFYIYPFSAEYSNRIEGQVADLNLTEIVAAFIGGEYA